MKRLLFLMTFLPLAAHGSICDAPVLDAESEIADLFDLQGADRVAVVRILDRLCRRVSSSTVEVDKEGRTIYRTRAKQDCNCDAIVHPEYGVFVDIDPRRRHRDDGADKEGQDRSQKNSRP